MSSSSSKSLFNLPGFRFHPTDQELVDFYLEKKVQGTLNIPPALFHDVDFYNYDPWELAEVYSDMLSTDDHYFFVPRDRKYPNGSRPKRLTVTGYWKATGCDKRILTAEGECCGLKKTLVFYRGKAPKGTKTGWIMNEFRLLRSDLSNSMHSKEVDVTLCRMYRKRFSYSSAVKLNVSFEEEKKKKRKNDGSAAGKKMKTEDFAMSSASSSTSTEKCDTSVKDELNSAEMFFWAPPAEDDLRLENLFPVTEESKLPGNEDAGCESLLFDSWISLDWTG